MSASLLKPVASLDQVSKALVDLACAQVGPGTSPDPCLSQSQIRPQFRKSTERGTGPLLEIALGGRAVRVQTQGGKDTGKRGTRQAITGFTERSRANLACRLKSINQHESPASEWRFITLTYHRQEVTARECHRHLTLMRKRLGRRFPTVAGFWKVEPQDRGTPHLHLLMRIPPGVDPEAVRAFFVKHWHAVADPTSDEHLRCLQFRAFSRAHARRDFFQALDSWQHIEGYVGKYMGKLISQELAKLWKFPGRFWGIINAKSLPVQILAVPLTKRAATILARACRKLIASRENGRVDVVAKSRTPGQPGLRVNLTTPARKDRMEERDGGPPGRHVGQLLSLLQAMKDWKSITVRRRRYQPRAGPVLRASIANLTMLRLVSWASEQAPLSPGERCDQVGDDVDRWLDKHHRAVKERDQVRPSMRRVAHAFARRKQIERIAAGALVSFTDRMESASEDLYAPHPWSEMPRLEGRLQVISREPVGRAKHAPAAAGRDV